MSLIHAAPEALRTRIEGSVLLKEEKTRLGGGLALLRHPSGDLIVKYGRDQQRTELLREVRLLRFLPKRAGLPVLVEFVDDCSTAFLVLERAPGVPLHQLDVPNVAAVVERVLVEVCEFLFAPTPGLLSGLPCGVEEELEDVRSLVATNRIREGDFKAASGGKDPKTVLLEVEQALEGECNDVLSHGDLCLPNILFDPVAEDWTLLDWGKSGRGATARDLSSLQGSLDRNGWSALFSGLMKDLGIQSDSLGSCELEAYRALDLFWHHS